MRRTAGLAHLRHVRRLLGEMWMPDRKRRVLMDNRDSGAAYLEDGGRDRRQPDRGDHFPCVIQLGVALMVATALLAVPFLPLGSAVRR